MRVCASLIAPFLSSPTESDSDAELRKERSADEKHEPSQWWKLPLRLCSRALCFPPFRALLLLHPQFFRWQKKATSAPRKSRSVVGRQRERSLSEVAPSVLFTIFLKRNSRGFASFYFFLFCFFFVGLDDDVLRADIASREMCNWTVSCSKTFGNKEVHAFGLTVDFSSSTPSGWRSGAGERAEKTSPLNIHTRKHFFRNAITWKNTNFRRQKRRKSVKVADLRHWSRILWISFCTTFDENLNKKNSKKTFFAIPRKSLKRFERINKSTFETRFENFQPNFGLHFQSNPATHVDSKIPISIASQSLPNWTTAKTQHEKAFFSSSKHCACVGAKRSVFKFNAKCDDDDADARLCWCGPQPMIKPLEWVEQEDEARRKKVNTKIAKKMGHVWSAYSARESTRRVACSDTGVRLHFVSLVLRLIVGWCEGAEGEKKAQRINILWPWQWTAENTLKARPTPALWTRVDFFQLVLIRFHFVWLAFTSANFHCQGDISTHMLGWFMPRQLSSYFIARFAVFVCQKVFRKQKYAKWVNRTDAVWVEVDSKKFIRYYSS